MASASAGQNEQFFCLVLPRWLFWKTSIVYISMLSGTETEEQQGFSSNSIIKLCSIVGFIEQWDEQMRFYFWRYATVTSHEFCYFNSRLFILDFAWNCCRLQEGKKFSRNPVQFKYVTRETIFHVSIAEYLIQNL